MFRVYARRIVPFVADLERFWVYAIMEIVRNALGGVDKSSAATAKATAKREASIALASPALPFPTFALRALARGFINVTPKTNNILRLDTIKSNVMVDHNGLLCWTLWFWATAAHTTVVALYC
jgi:hypothetical protein